MLFVCMFVDRYSMHVRRVQRKYSPSCFIKLGGDGSGVHLTKDIPSLL